MTTDTQARAILARIVEIVEHDGDRHDSDAATADDLSKYDEIVLLAEHVERANPIDASAVSVEVRRVGDHARLFVNSIGCASWPWNGPCANDTTGEQYATEVARCVRMALASVEPREPFSELRTSALLAFVDTFESLGGARDLLDGRLWDAYYKSCLALGREAKVKT